MVSILVTIGTLFEIQFNINKKHVIMCTLRRKVNLSSIKHRYHIYIYNKYFVKLKEEFYILPYFRNQTVRV